MTIERCCFQFKEALDLIWIKQKCVYETSMVVVPSMLIFTIANSYRLPHIYVCGGIKMNKKSIWICIDIDHSYPDAYIMLVALTIEKYQKDNVWQRQIVLGFPQLKASFSSGYRSMKSVVEIDCLIKKVLQARLKL